MNYMKNMGSYETSQKTRVTQQPGGNSTFSLAWGGSQEEPSSRQKQGGRARDRSQGPLQQYGRQGGDAYSDSLDTELNRRNSGNNGAGSQNQAFGQRVTQKTTNDYQERSSVKINQQHTSNVQFGDYDYFKSDPYTKKGTGPVAARPPLQQQKQHQQQQQQQQYMEGNTVDTGYDLHQLQKEYQIPIYAMERDVRDQAKPPPYYDQGSTESAPVSQRPPRSPFVAPQQAQQHNPYGNQMPPRPPSNQAPQTYAQPPRAPAGGNNNKGVNHPFQGFSNGYRVNQPPGGRSQITFG